MLYIMEVYRSRIPDYIHASLNNIFFQYIIIILFLFTGCVIRHASRFLTTFIAFSSNVRLKFFNSSNFTDDLPTLWSFTNHVYVINPLFIIRHHLMIQNSLLSWIKLFLNLQFYKKTILLNHDFDKIAIAMISAQSIAYQ